MNTLSALIAEQPFFKDLHPQHLPVLEACAELKRFGAHQKIFENGYPAEYFYLIVSGEVSLETHFAANVGARGIQSLEAGAPLGWSWLFPPHDWQFTASAQREVEVIVFDGRKLREAMDRDPVLGYDIAMRVGNMLGERLQSTRAGMLNPYK